MGAPICGVHWIPISDKEGFMKDSKNCLWLENSARLLVQDEAKIGRIISAADESIDGSFRSY
ncbi:predicted protein [Sclerotinia sclerotiorum 1980 UF-70]|uniref:Uncharacterized protein n=1 Tax=Sclerotinia sclerotiorum (strain ATCC 18683 / 1980 / Ss-1) TaxID=665079 RepID=A7EQ54_SCLS1|nr:predicted protein [Sclerotinia sclerotiorum 1980 UF-70]EDO04970.1 predicted protein [Sclerotinia sclerotiorum 1980 UF-70]